MRSLILSQCIDLRIGVTREDLGALTTVRGRQCSEKKQKSVG